MLVIFSERAYIFSINLALMPFGDIAQLLKLWKWAFGKWYRTLIAIPVTVAAFAMLISNFLRNQRAVASFSKLVF
jgi:hypothetical protein